jgi:hypothetical protein
MTRWLWSGADGVVTDLSAWSAGSYVLDGITGHLAPTYEFATQQTAGVDGEQLQQVTPQAGSVVLPVDFVASDAAELRSRVRSLAHALRPRAGIGVLTAVADDGTARTLPCYYRKGLEAGRYNVARFRAALEFWAPSPWWRGDPVTVGYGLAAPTPFFPILPLVLSASTITGQTTIDLSATDAPTWPVWTVTGPGTQLTLSNTYTRPQDDGTVATVTSSLVLNSAIGDGQTVTIDSRPGRQSAVRSDGLSVFASLGSDPALFPLVDGVNTVRAVLTNAGANSRISGVADRLYSGVL